MDYPPEWSIIPIGARGKKPLIPWAKYQAQRATAEERAAWGKQWPECNWALVCGAISGVIVLDIDGPSGWEYLEKHDYFLPPTRKAVTSPGKAHFYFKHPGFEVRPKNLRHNLGADIDIKGDGGYVLLPPSIHPKGHAYAWETEDETADCPFWLLEMSKGVVPTPDLVEATGPGRALPAAGELSPAVVISGTDLLPPEISKDWANLLAEGADKGSRNTALASVVGHYVRKDLTDGEIFQFLSPFIARCRPPLTDKDLQTTILSVRRTHDRNNLISGAIPGAKPQVANEPLNIEDEGDRAKLIQAIGAKLGIPLHQIYRMVGEETKFIFKVDTREVWMSTAELFTFKSFQAKIADLTKRAVIKDKKTVWEIVCQRVMDAAIDIQPGPEASAAGKLNFYIQNYLASHPPREECGSSDDPFFLEEYVGIFLTSLKKYLKVTCDEVYKTHDLAQRLKSLGAENTLQRVNGQPRRFWKLPKGFKNV
jgi:hypothetical protein